MQLDDLIDSIASLKAKISSLSDYVSTLNTYVTDNSAKTLPVFCLNEWADIDAASLIKLLQDSLTAMNTQLASLQDLQNSLQQTLDNALAATATSTEDDTSNASE